MIQDTSMIHPAFSKAGQVYSHQQHISSLMHCHSHELSCSNGLGYLTSKPGTNDQKHINHIKLIGHEYLRLHLKNNIKIMNYQAQQLIGYELSQGTLKASFAGFRDLSEPLAKPLGLSCIASAMLASEDKIKFSANCLRSWVFATI